MNPRRGVALVLLLALLSGCAPASSSSSRGSTQRGSTSPRVRCLSDPARDDASGTRPLLYFLCVESP